MQDVKSKRARVSEWEREKDLSSKGDKVLSVVDQNGKRNQKFRS